MKNTNKRNKLVARRWLANLFGLIGLCLSFSAIATETTSETASIHVTITTHLGDEQHFREGDEISLLLSLNHDAYVLLVYQDASGDLVKLFPVRKDDNGRVSAGDFMPFPRRADGLRLVVAPPFGEEQVWAFATAEAFPARPLLNTSDINTLRIRLQRSGIHYSEAYTRLRTHAGQQ
ncbi:MAG: DUF4384 domain-containing protein [Gammaproteobacteria bacterium]|nr:DUF4384 domain-containing protein [Gammaproteobacteria bacterium]